MTKHTRNPQLTTAQLLATERIALTSNDAMLTRHFAGDDGARFRITVRINSYEFQSYAALNRWDGAQWRLVTSLVGNELTTWKEANSARIRKTFTGLHVLDDVQTLMDEAEFITDNFT